LAASPDGITAFSMIIQLVRLPIRNEPENLTPFEQYVLMDAFFFFKTGMVFPSSSEPVTYLEYVFLLEAYKVYYEEQHTSISGPMFEQSMKQVDNIGGANVSR